MSPKREGSRTIVIAVCVADYQRQVALIERDNNRSGIERVLHYRHGDSHNDNHNDHIRHI